MKKIVLTATVIFFLIIILLPALISWPGSDNGESYSSDKHQLRVRVYMDATKKTVEMPLEEYLVGVVAAEMPAEFEIEALKAQAIAARTYSVKRIEKLDTSRHPGKEVVHICTNPTHCQAWLSSDELKERWGLLKYPVYIHKVRTAVRETAGKVLVYDNQLTDPVYHGSCGGVGTEDSENVWKYQIPYLRGVDCAWDDMDNPKLTNKVTIPVAELAKKLSLKKDQHKNIGPLLQKASYSSTGRFVSMTLDGEAVPASVLRSDLALDSTVFSWAIKDGAITIETKGKGHGVGMCQYGANGLAKEGKNSQHILGHYYKGAKLVDY